MAELSPMMKQYFKIKEEIEKCKTKKDIEEYVIRRLKERHII